MRPTRARTRRRRVALRRRSSGVARLTRRARPRLAGPPASLTRREHDAATAPRTTCRRIGTRRRPSTRNSCFAASLQAIDHTREPLEDRSATPTAQPRMGKQLTMNKAGTAAHDLSMATKLGTAVMSAEALLALGCARRQQVHSPGRRAAGRRRRRPCRPVKLMHPPPLTQNRRPPEQSQISRAQRPAPMPSEQIVSDGEAAAVSPSYLAGCRMPAGWSPAGVPLAAPA